MSITPFLPGLPAPVPADGAPAATEQSGDLGVVFGDALAAALLATVPLPTGPAVGSTTPAAAGAPATASPVATTPVATTIAPVVAPEVTPAAAAPEPSPAPATEPAPFAPVAPTAPTAEEAPGTRLPSLPTDDATAKDPLLPRLEPTAPAVDGATQPTTQPTTQPAAAPAAPIAGTARPTVERAVVQQVFPEVTRLVAGTPTDRPGTHRITLTLQPEQLGEVRVTLVVKDGAVQVRLAGGSDDAATNAAVHRALSSGAPELQRLLERSGASEARVLVRDPSAPAPAPQPTAPAAPVAATGQPGGGTVSPDAGREGASAWNRSSGDPDQRRQRRDVPEPPPALAPTAPTTAPTIPAGQLDRTL